MYDSLGKRVGRLERLAEPVIEKGVTYNFKVSVKPKEGVGYVLRAELAAGRKAKANFVPTCTVRQEQR